MSAIAQALRPHRIRRFGAVFREEGPRVAFARAAAHLKMLAAGQGRTDLARTSATGGSRFAFGSAWWDMARDRAFHLTAPPARAAGRRSVAVIGDLNLPQCRKYRVEQMDEIWAGLGIGYEYSHVEDIPRCREILQHATHLVFYRVRRSDLVSMYAYEARRLGLPILYDIDDPLFSVSAYARYSNLSELERPMARHFLDEAPLYLDAMNGADALSFSTPGLLEHAARYSARPAFLRRNFADARTLEAGAAARRGAARRRGFTVALASGSKGHDADIEVARDGLCRFLAGGADRWLLILGDLDKARFPEAVRPYIRSQGFADYPRYLAALAEADCLLLPLTDDPFNRCKSAVRAIDAAAVSVPVLASPVGDQAGFVEDGRTGILIRDDGWGEALEALAGCPGEAAAMGRAARTALEAHWTARAEAPVVDPGLIDWVRE